MNFAQSFGESLKSLPVDNKNIEIPNNTVELVTNIFSNLKQQPQTKENFNNTQQQPQQQPQTQSQQKNNKVSVFVILKISAILVITHIILSLEITKTLLSKLTENTVYTYAITSIIFLMVAFFSLKTFI
jgi:hypothetical protein